MNIWAFWEPQSTLPEYLRLCIETWKQIPNAEIHLLNYRNIWKYIDVDAYGPNLFNGGFQMAQIGDAIRAMLIEKYGGVWLDVDTIITNPKAGEYFTRKNKPVTFFGNVAEKTCHMALIAAQRPGTAFAINWVAFNKYRIWNLPLNAKTTPWGYLGGDFVEPYVYSHPEEIEILDMNLVHPKEQMARVRQSNGGGNYKRIYEDYFFMESHHLEEISEYIVVLNNTWTPELYKKFKFDELLQMNCTVTNLLTEILDLKRVPQIHSFKR